MNSARLRPFAVPALAASAIFIALMGFAHTPTGRDAWRKVWGSSCPFSAQWQHTAEQRDQDRAAQAASLRGSLPARARTAMGFALDSTTRADINAWAEQSNAHCAIARTSGELECATAAIRYLPQDAVSAPGTLFFDFDAQQRLKKVSAQVSLNEPASAVTAMRRIIDHVTQNAGGAADVAGEISPTYLAGGPLRRTQAQFRYQHYYVRASILSLGNNFVLSQTYQSL